MVSPITTESSNSEIKGEIKIRLLISAVLVAVFMAFNQNKKVIPISNKPT